MSDDSDAIPPPDATSTSTSSHQHISHLPSDSSTIPDDVTQSSPHPDPTPASDSSLSTIFRSAIDSTLIFISKASNETLGACVVGLGATTYFVLGRVGLILIGAVGGVVLHASWESSSTGLGDGKDEGEALRKRETGLQVALRLLQWRESQISSREQDQDASEISSHEKLGPLDFSEYPPETARAMNVLTDAVIRDYVHYWYSPVAPDDQLFPAVSRKTYASFLLALASNISRKRPADSFLEFVTNSSSIIIVLLHELATALSASPSSPPKDAVFAYLDMQPQSNLANILDHTQQQRRLQTIANDILETYLDPAVFNCPPARVFLREILANSVLDMTLQNCSRSDWINEWIVYLLEEGEPELLNAIDAGVEGSNQQNISKPNSTSDSTTTRTTVDDPVSPLTSDAANKAEHKRNISRAEEAMDDAMREAQRLTQLIIEEEAKRAKEKEDQQRTKEVTTLPSVDYASDSTNPLGIQTPTSSQSGSQLDHTEPAAHPEPTQAAVSEVQPDTITPTQPVSDTINTDNLPSAQIGHDSLHEENPEPIQSPEVFSLHKANIQIFDDADPNDRRSLKSKPLTEYMIQIEPSSSQFPGWMIARTYTDFETLHEVLRRISTISGTIAFTEAHSQLPSWRGKTKAQLTSDLERYLIDAIQFEALAESEGMKRFLEKSRAVSKSPTKQNAFWASSAAIENMGKGMFDAISKAPKGVAGGSKAVLGGVTSVLGGVQNASKRTVSSSTAASRASTSASDLTRQSTTHESGSITESTAPSTTDISRMSVDSSANTKASLSGPGTPVRTSSSFEQIPPASPQSLSTAENIPAVTGTSSIPSTPATPQLNLPPRPSELPDMFPIPQEQIEEQTQLEAAPVDLETILSPSIEERPATARKSRHVKNNAPLSEQEATVTIELLFAVINELYTLSSAWNIRRTLLNAAKTYLLRPGNPQLENIRVLLQDSVLEANTSDSGIAAQILKLRENSLPTEEELKGWPAPLTPTESEALRKKARKLLVEKGMPQALMSVMGAAASGEALGKVFDCLQIQEVARGLLFGLMLQAVRAMTQ